MGLCIKSGSLIDLGAQSIQGVPVLIVQVSKCKANHRKFICQLSHKPPLLLHTAYMAARTSGTASDSNQQMINFVLWLCYVQNVKSRYECSA